jgi:hypothetical protein
MKIFTTHSCPPLRYFCSLNLTVSHRIIQGKDWVLSPYVLSSYGLPLHPTCLVLTASEARSYFASTIPVYMSDDVITEDCPSWLLGWLRILHSVTSAHTNARRSSCIDCQLLLADFNRKWDTGISANCSSTPYYQTRKSINFFELLRMNRLTRRSKISQLSLRTPLKSIFLRQHLEKERSNLVMQEQTFM